MKLRVLYTDGGVIVSLARMPEKSDADGPAGGAEPDPQGPRIAARPGRGRRVAVVEVDPAWEERPLTALHASHTVVDGPRGARLKPTASRRS